jgi:hypothetical protein
MNPVAGSNQHALSLCSTQWAPGRRGQFLADVAFAVDKLCAKLSTKNIKTFAELADLGRSSRSSGSAEAAAQQDQAHPATAAKRQVMRFFTGDAVINLGPKRQKQH